MIRVDVVRDHQQQVRQITMQGHADFSTAGSDIVCAAVSGIVITLINAAELLLQQPYIDCEQRESGFLRCTVSSIENKEVEEKLQFLLNAMIIAVQQVEAQYPKHVRVKQTNSNTGGE